MGGQRTPKWTGSEANNYISRARACRKLQISLPMFRKLCILKGIYPHDPRKKHKKEGLSKVYYHVKDIKYLKREPILWKYRAQQAFRTKIVKYKDRHDWDKVKRMTNNTPQMSLDHLVRERYPRFSNALQDLDDPLTMVHAFASLPSGRITELTASRRLQCQRVCREFQNYVAECGLLRKAFVSVKGIYYQARIRKKYDVTWIVPHQFVYDMPNDIDYSVMSTFLEFYQTLLKFVNFRLYIKSYMHYPPFGEIDYDITNMSLTQLRKRGNTIYGKKQANTKSNNNSNSNSNSNSNGTTKVISVDLSKILPPEELAKNEAAKPVEKTTKVKYAPNNLFHSFKFLLNRETPQLSLEFVILSLGGQVLFEQDCKNEYERNDTRITHQIVDRKTKNSDKLATREYIQPQWVYDCLNAGCIVPVEHYQPGVQCPPHLSPFVNYDEHHHKPSQAFVIEHWQELAKMYKGYVPSAKILEKRKNLYKPAATNTTSNEPEGKEEEAKIETGLEASDWNNDIMGMGVDMKTENENNPQANENAKEEVVADFLDDTEEVPKTDVYMPNKKSAKKAEAKLLTNQRLEIANQRRRTEKVRQVKVKTYEEREMENLAKTFMTKKSKKFYNNVVRKQKNKGAYWDKMEQKRLQHERQQN